MFRKFRVTNDKGWLWLRFVVVVLWAWHLYVSFRDSSYALGVFDILVFCFFI